MLSEPRARRRPPPIRSDTHVRRVQRAGAQPDLPGRLVAQIPVDAIEPRRVRAGQRAHDLALLIRDRDRDAARRRRLSGSS